MALQNELKIIAQTPYKSLEDWKNDLITIPQLNELIVYTIDDIPFFKIGNGESIFNDLPEFKLDIKNLYQNNEDYLVISGLSASNITSKIAEEA